MAMEKKSLKSKKAAPASSTKSKTSKAKVDTKKPETGKVVAAFRAL
jgi:hypothetical protein